MEMVDVAPYVLTERRIARLTLLLARSHRRAHVYCSRFGLARES